MKLPSPISCRSSHSKKDFSISPTQPMFEVDGPRVQGDGLPQEPDLALAATIQVAMSANRSVSSPWASPMVVLQCDEMREAHEVSMGAQDTIEERARAAMDIQPESSIVRFEAQLQDVQDVYDV